MTVPVADRTLRRASAPSTERGERTRRRLAETVAHLVEETGALPIAKEVADRADVSVRLVFYYFESMEELYGAVIEVLVDRHWRPLRPIGANLRLTRRIFLTVRQRAALFEAITPYRKVGAELARRSARITERLAEADAELRARLSLTFSPELDASTTGDALLEAVARATSWEVWDHLRREKGLSVTASRRSVAQMLTGLLW